MENIIALANNTWREYQSDNTAEPSTKRPLTGQEHETQKQNWRGFLSVVERTANADTPVARETIQAKVDLGHEIVANRIILLEHTGRFTAGDRFSSLNKAKVVASTALDVLSKIVNDASTNRPMSLKERGTRLIELLQQCPQITPLLTDKSTSKALSPFTSLVGDGKLVPNATTLKHAIVQGIREKQPTIFPSDDAVFNKYPSLNYTISISSKEKHQHQACNACLDAVAQFAKDYTMSVSTALSHNEALGFVPASYLSR